MKFKSEALIIDEDENNQVRPCNYNYVRMTIFEIVYCKIFVWKLMSRTIKYQYCYMLTGLKDFLYHFSQLLLLPIMPILLYISARKDIKEAKEQVWKSKCYKCEYEESSLILNECVEEYIIGIDECIQCKLINGEPTRYIKSIEKRWKN